jgi:hypothetical protein
MGRAQKTSDVYHKPMKLVFVGVSGELRKEIKGLMGL